MLDNFKTYEKFDKGKVGESIRLLPEQIGQVFGDLPKIKNPKLHQHIKRVVLNGMGGSNLGARIIKSVFADKLKVPITITPGYQVPSFVDKETLYVLSSYSGSTEEVLSVYQEVKKRKAFVVAIAADQDNKLQALIKKDNIPCYLFDPVNDPSDQPRMGLGYSVFGTIALLSSVGILKEKNETFLNAINLLQVTNNKLVPEIKTKDNLAKTLAKELFGHVPILAGAEFLSGNIMAMRNQFCENSKNFAEYLLLPDMNHFAMEGLAHPKSLSKNFVFVFIESEFYHPRIQKRIELTKEIVRKNKIKTLSIKLTGRNKLEQSFELLQLGSWLTYYLGVLNKVNPVEIKWVDWFKKELSKEK